MSKSNRSPWEEFLPPGAIVMAKKSAACQSAKLVIIGDARPFLGEAGELLNRMLEAIGLRREEVCLTCLAESGPELQGCIESLNRELDLIQPQAIVTMGTFAAQTLLQTQDELTKLRGRFHSYRGVQLMPTFHPAFLLSNTGAKRESWSDLQQVAKALGLVIKKR